jgi:hypothetical protein
MISPDASVWAWAFYANGKFIGVEGGPLHGNPYTCAVYFASGGGLVKSVEYQSLANTTKFKRLLDASNNSDACDLIYGALK